HHRRFRRRGLPDVAKAHRPRKRRSDVLLQNAALESRPLRLAPADVGTGESPFVAWPSRPCLLFFRNEKCMGETPMLRFNHTNSIEYVSLFGRFNQLNTASPVRSLNVALLAPLLAAVRRA